MKYLPFLFAVISLLNVSAQPKTEQYYLQQAPFKMLAVREPVFPDRVFAITAYGADGDGHTLNTRAFEKAIEACAKSGGGKVIVSAGMWLTGPIQLQSNVNLVVERGAIVQFTTDHRQYPIIKMDGIGQFMVAPPVYGYGLTNVAITGEGIIDGAGESWRPLKKEKVTEAQWARFVSSGGVVDSGAKVWWPSRQAMEGEVYLRNLRKNKMDLTQDAFLPARDFMRPKMVVISNSNRVLVEGVTIRNSPRFVLNPVNCTDLTIRRVNIFNEEWAQNGDGIDISGCKGVMIYKCNVSAGDDGICMKSSRGESVDESRLENVVIAGCNVYRGHGGFVIGSNTDGGMNNIFVTDCNFIGTDIGIRVKSFEGGGGLVHNVFIKNIFMSDILNEAILFTTYYDNAVRKAKNSKALDTGKVPSFKDFFISNVFCMGAQTAISITGLPQMPVEKIYFDTVKITAKRGYVYKEAKDISFKNVEIALPD